MDSFNETWNLVCDYCKARMTKVGFQTWISRIEPKEIDFDLVQIKLLVPNDFHRQTLNRCYNTLLEEAFEEIFGQKFEVKLLVPEEIEKDVPQEMPSESNEDEAPLTFDNYIVGSSNKFAHAASIAVAQNPGGTYNPLFIYGNSGLGKTHLLHAIKNEVLKNDPSKKIAYVIGKIRALF